MKLREAELRRMIARALREVDLDELDPETLARCQEIQQQGEALAAKAAPIAQRFADLLPVVSRTKLLYVYDTMEFDSVEDIVDHPQMPEYLDEFTAVYVLSIGDDPQFDYNDQVLQFTLAEDGSLLCDMRGEYGDIEGVSLATLRRYLTRKQLPAAIKQFVADMLDSGEASIKDDVDTDVDLSEALDVSDPDVDLLQQIADLLPIESVVEEFGDWFGGGGNLMSLTLPSDPAGLFANAEMPNDDDFGASNDPIVQIDKAGSIYCLKHTFPDKAKTPNYFNSSWVRVERSVIEEMTRAGRLHPIIDATVRDFIEIYHHPIRDDADVDTDVDLS